MKRMSRRFPLIATVISMAVLLISACSSGTQVGTATQTSVPTQQTAATASPSALPSSIPSPGAATQAPSTSATDSMGGMVMVPQTGNQSNSGTPQIKVSDQTVNNGMVMVDDVLSAGPGWVVIYTINANGQPDQAIGETAVKDGENKGVMVQVDPTKAQGTLEALLHVDKGQVGTFESPGPDAPVMSGIQMVAAIFKITQATANAGATTAPTQAAPTANGMEEMVPQPTKAGTTPAIIVANQPIVDKTVILPEVISNGDAWVVIHKQNGDGTMGPMAGYAHVTDGVNRKVVVPVDTNLTSTIMYAMLHQDNAKKSSPQFPGEDSPIMVNGQMIAPTFEVTDSANADIVINLGNTPNTTNYLVDGQQMTLYISLQDVPGKSNCTGDCLATWHPVIATGRIVAGTGIPNEKLGVIFLPDGSRQVTYANAPLYLYSKDEKPGDVNGQGYNGSWYLVVP